MDWTAIISAIVAVIGGGGGLYALLMYRPEKHGKEIANEGAVSEQWQHIVEEKNAEIAQKNAEIAQRDDVIARQSNKIESLYKENGFWRESVNRLKAQKAVLTILKCTRETCTNRQPPLATHLDVNKLFDKDGTNNSNGERE